MRIRARTLLWIAVLALVAFGVVRAFRPVPVLVDAAAVQRGELVVTIEDDGHTRVRERYTVHAPIRGMLLRTPLDPGDHVVAGETVVATFRPAAPELLDARTRAIAQARLEATRSAIEEARARREQAAAEAEFATAERERVAELVATGISSPELLEAAERDARARREALRAAEFAVQVATFEAETAAAQLREFEVLREDGERQVSGNGPSPHELSLRSPIDGVVLRVLEESARALAAGAPIVEIGDVASLEIVADFLSQDAVRIRPGMPARIVGWGGDLPTGEPVPLAATVRVVEPSGYTKISALGVEEQRVDVVLDPVGPTEPWQALGDGYRVDAAIEVWRAADVLLVPTGALFRDGEDWAVFVAVDGAAQLRQVTIGRRSGLDAEVIDGSAAGDVVVMYPSALIDHGALVHVR